MTTYGITTAGFVPKTLDVIITEMQNEARLQFGTDVDLTETSPLQKFIEVEAMEVARLWDMAESIYYSGFLETAEGASLDIVVRHL